MSKGRSPLLPFLVSPTDTRKTPNKRGLFDFRLLPFLSLSSLCAASLPALTRGDGVILAPLRPHLLRPRKVLRRGDYALHGLGDCLDEERRNAHLPLPLAGLVSGSPHQVSALSQDQERELVQRLYLVMNRRSAGILLALFAGLRIGELCALQMKNIDLTAKTLTVGKTIQRIYDAKSGKTRLHTGPPKTATSERTIPLPSMLAIPLGKFITDNPDHYFLTGKGKPTEPRTYRQFFARFLKKHVLAKMRFHEIRHTFAVRAMAIPKFDIKSLSEILGRKNVSFTLNVYGRANLQQKTRCMNLLNDLL